MVLGRNVKKQIKRNDLNINDVTEEAIMNLKNKIKVEKIDNRQQGKITYKVWDIVITVFLAVLCNCNDWDDIETFAKSKYKFLRKYLKMTGGIPTSITYERVIGSISKNTLESLCLFFLTEIINLKKKKHREIINIDGKVDKSSSYNYIDDNGVLQKIKNLNVLNVYSNNYSMCLFSEMIEDKTNEITAFPNTINALNIRNAIITVDALNTQKENCKLVKKKRGDYVFALKGNQGDFFEDVQLYFNKSILNILKKDEKCYLHMIETRGNEKIVYEYYQTNDISWYHDYKSWKGLKTIGLVIKTITKIDGTTTTEKRYYISSLDIDIDLFSESIRKHWSVENKLHWQLDYTFKQDQNTTIDKDALLGLQIIKKTALAFLTPIKEKRNISYNKLRLSISLNVEEEIENLFEFYAKKR